jgi:hypothetical protein
VPPPRGPGCCPRRHAGARRRRAPRRAAAATPAAGLAGRLATRGLRDLTRAGDPEQGLLLLGSEQRQIDDEQEGSDDDRLRSDDADALPAHPLAPLGRYERI